MDVDNLLQYFVVENIITMDEEDKIKSLNVKSEKVRYIFQVPYKLVILMDFTTC